MASYPTNAPRASTTGDWPWTLPPNSGGGWKGHGSGMTQAFPIPGVTKEELLVALIAIAKINDKLDALIERLDAKEKEA
jgi:hypothetical protein